MRGINATEIKFELPEADSRLFTVLRCTVRGRWAALYLQLYHNLHTRGPGFVHKAPRAQCSEVGTHGELRRILQPSQDPVLWT